MEEHYHQQQRPRGREGEMFDRAIKRVRTVSPDRCDYDSIICEIEGGRPPCIADGSQEGPTPTMVFASNVRKTVSKVLLTIDLLALDAIDRHRDTEFTATRLLEVLEQLHKWVGERGGQATFLEAFRDFGGVSRLIDFIQKCAIMKSSCNGFASADYAGTMASAVQMAVQSLSHCLYYSQSDDEPNVREASSKMALSIITAHDGMGTLLRAVENQPKAMPSCPTESWREVTAFWVLLNNLTLFGDAMTFCDNSVKIRLVHAALDCLEQHVDSDEKSHVRKFLPMWSSAFGVLSNLLVRDCASAPTFLSLVRGYIDSRAVERCIAFVQCIEGQLYQQNNHNRTLLVRVLDFFHQCTRKPAVDSETVHHRDYQDFLLPLCVNAVKSAHSDHSLTSSLETQVLRKKICLHACIILNKCVQKKIEKSIMREAGLISAVGMIIESMSHPPRALTPRVTVTGGMSQEMISSHLVRELAFKILREVIPTPE
jgi:hypothetical protein